MEIGARGSSVGGAEVGPLGGTGLKLLLKVVLTLVLSQVVEVVMEVELGFLISSFILTFVSVQTTVCMFLSASLFFLAYC